jgi:CubicO group peptidase (beta-lactamase class C family)
MSVECTPEEVGLSSSRLNRIATNVIDRFVGEGHIPFGHVLVSRKNKICYEYKTGNINVAEKIPVQDDSMFRIYSMTKPMTSVVLMSLQEQGMFQLTDPLSLYLPEFDKSKLKVYTGGLKQLGNGDFSYDSQPCRYDITIQMLMTHTSGLSYGFDRAGFINPVDRLYHQQGPGTSGNNFGKPDLTLKDFCIELAKMPLVCQPGTEWNYSLSVDVQGRLIEVLTGKSLYDAMKDILFVPLNMIDTHFAVPKKKLTRFSELYVPNPFTKSDVKKMKKDEVTNNIILSAAKKKGDPKAVIAATSYIQKKRSKRTGEFSRLIPPKKLIQFAESGNILNITPMTQHSFVKGMHGVDENEIQFESGGGGLVSTMSDYYKFAYMLSNGGIGMNGQRILSRKTLQFMTINHLPNNVDLGALSSPQYSEIGTAGSGFGLGFSVVTDPTRQGNSTSVGTFAWGGAASTYFWVDPTEDIIVIFMTQLLGNGGQNRDTIYQSLKGLPMRPMIKSIVYGSIIDGGPLKTNQLFSSGTPTPKL